MEMPKLAIFIFILFYMNHAAAASGWLAKSGVGFVNLQTSKSGEYDKNGYLIPAEAGWRMEFERPLTLHLTGGLTYISLSGSKNSETQGIIQQSMMADQSFYYTRHPSLAAGLGVRHLIGPGSGLEFQNTESGLWVVMAGLRAMISPPGQRLFLQASWDTTVNLSVGRANLILISAGYNFGQIREVLSSGRAPENQSPSVRQSEEGTQEKLSAVPLPPEPIPTPSPTKRSSVIPEIVFHEFSHQIIRFSDDKQALTKGSREFLNDLIEDLIYKFKSDWVGFEITCARAGECRSAARILRNHGVQTIRIIERKGADSHIRVQIKQPALSSYIDSRERQRLANHRLAILLEKKLTGRVELSSQEASRLRSLFRNLKKNELRWRNAIIVFPPGVTPELRSAVIRSAKQVGLKDFETVRDSHKGTHLTVEIDLNAGDTGFEIDTE